MMGAALANIPSTTAEDSPRRPTRWTMRIWRAVRPIMIGAVSLIIISGMLLSGWNYINSKFFITDFKGDELEQIPIGMIFRV